jgi:hypothetical protein
MGMDENINIICIQWGTAYTSIDINKLYRMISRNTTLPFNFYLFSNEKFDDLDERILHKKEPGIKMPFTSSNLNYRKTVGLCDENLGGLAGKRVFFFDLDVIIMSNLDELFTYPEGDKFYIINDWKTKGNHVGQATCYSFVVGTLGYVKDDFESDPTVVIDQYGTATQQYLSAKVVEKYGPLTFWPELWFQSFKFHCLPPVVLRRFLTAPRPNSDTKVLAFHGNPNIKDAIMGVWQSPGSAKKENKWKSLYKSFKPVPWINEYWQ